METVFMKCQVQFSEKNKKSIINLLSAELAQKVVMVKMATSLPENLIHSLELIFFDTIRNLERN